MSRDSMFEIGAAAMASVAAALILLKPATMAPAAPVGLALTVGWIAWRDARDFVIPDGASAALLALAFAARLADEGLSWTNALLALADGAACAAALWAIREIYYRLRGYDGLGLGDVKLAAGAGVLVGPFGFSIAVLAASFAGLAVVALRTVRDGGFDRSARLPLGTLLAPAALGVWALGLAPSAG